MSLVLLIAGLAIAGLLAAAPAAAREEVPGSPRAQVEQAQAGCGPAGYLGSDGSDCPPAWLGPDYIAMTAVGCVDY